MNQPNNHKPKVQTPLSPDQVEKLLINQEKELELRARELQLQSQQDNHSFQFAQAALEAQAKDRESDRIHQSKRSHLRYIFIGILVILVIFFLLAASYMNKDAMAMEVVKMVGVFLCGGGGGYAYGKYSSKEPDDTQQS